MFAQLRSLTLGTGLLAVCALPLACQTERHTEHTIHTSGEDTRIRWIHNGRSVELRMDGSVEFSDDETEVRRVSPGGRFSLEEQLRGRPDRRVEFRAGPNGGLTRAYFVNGRRESWDASARAWLTGLLPEMARENGIGAEARVARIHARQGSAGVLGEIGRIRSGGSQVAHLRALLDNHPLSAAETMRVLQQVERIDSDSQKAALLRTLAERRDLEQGAVQHAFFDAVDAIGSDTQRQGVLGAVLEQRTPSEPVLAAVLESTAKIGSDTQKASLLVEVAERFSLAGPHLREGFFDAAVSIGSDTQHARVLTSVLRGQGNRPDVVLAVLRSAQSIGSDSQKAEVLLAVPPARLRDQATANAFTETMRTIGSDSQRARVATFALENRS